MPIEVEQKYRLSDPEAVLSKMVSLGAESRHVIRQVDTYYAHPMRDFATTDEALRIRRVGESNFITYKGPKLDASTKTRREIDLPLASGEQTATSYGELLEALSFQRVATVSKIRQVYEIQRDGQTIELALDQVHELGDFVELEIVVPGEDQVPAAQELTAGLASELQLSDSERRSYLEMLLEE